MIELPAVPVIIEILAALQQPTLDCRTQKIK